MSKFDVSRYKIHTEKLNNSIRLALLSDLHSREDSEVREILDITRSKKPDYILMPGDIFERLDGSRGASNEKGFELMEECCNIAPVLFSVGNHENGGIRSWNKLKWMTIKSIPKYFDSQELERIEKSGAVFLDDGYVIKDGIAFGGLSSGLINEGREPCVTWLDEYCSLDMPKILLCHHPEYYQKYLKDRSIDMIVSGHAHGGQWRFLGRGVFAPGQGLFPKYTSGVHDGRLVISRGLKPSGAIPRIFNKPEIVFITLTN